MPNNLARQILGVAVGDTDIRQYTPSVSKGDLIRYDDALNTYIDYNSPYLYYSAYLDQVIKLGPPDLKETYITEYINTLGVPVTWVPDGTGFFYASLPGIPIDNVVLSIFPGSLSYTSMNTIVGGGITFNAKISLTKASDYSPCDIFLYAQDMNGNSLDFASAVADNKYLIEFKVLKSNYTPTLVQTIIENI